MRHGRLTLHSDDLTLRFADVGRPRPASRADLLTVLDGFDPAETTRITLAGGSPLEHPFFDDLVEEIRDRGFASIALETDGAPLADDGVIQRLCDLDLSYVTIVCGGIRRNVYDRMIRRPGTYKRAMLGIHGALTSNLRTYVAVPLARPSAPDVLPLLDWLLELPGDLAGYLLAVPETGRVHPALRALLMRHDAVADLARRAFSRCHESRVEYGFGSKRGIAACSAAGVMDRFGTVFHDRFTFFRSRDEPLERIAVCADCSLNQSCGGLEPAYVAAFGDDGTKPVPLAASMAWKLRKLNSLDEFDYKHVSPFKTGGGTQARSLLRINGHCNMSCAFCFVDRTVPDFDTAELKRDIDRFAESGAGHLVLSGGEPTLHPDLTELVRHAKGHAFHTIEIQTNGVKAADMALASELVDAGLNKVSISLHSTDPEHSDRITRLPKAFGKTVAAIHNFRDLGIVTQIAHVITKNNYERLPETFEFFSKEFPPGRGHLSVCLAIAQGMSDLVYMWVVPSFGEIKPFVKKALDHALETGIGFGGMIGQGGYPPCMLDGDLKYYEQVLDQIYLSDDFDAQFYKAPRCKDCSFDERCVGVRRSYVEAYGDDEIRPFEADVTGVAPLPVSVSTGSLVQLRPKAAVSRH